MRYDECDFVLTGATGILGSHVLYELTRKCLEGEISGKLILLVRSSKTQTAQERIAKIFGKELIPDYLKEYRLEEILHWIRVVDVDLKDGGATLNTLRKHTQKAVFIHMASLVDLGKKESTRWKIYENNFLPTLDLLYRCKELTCKFVFISTAFASGERDGVIGDEFLNLNLKKRRFRNHYEEQKLLAEHEVSRICTENNIPFQILRPSIICGRLIDPPFFVIPKFLTFYLFGEFFYTIKTRHNGTTEKVRISLNDTGVLNIVPVDYTAKAIVKALDHDEIREMNIANQFGVSIAEIAGTILECVEYMDYDLVSAEPELKNHSEELYYKVIGEQFNLYIHSPKAEYHTRHLNTLMEEVPMPDIRQHLFDLLTYAYRNKFIDTF